MVKVIKFQKNKKKSGDLKFRPDQHTAAFIIRKQSGASDWFLLNCRVISLGKI